MNRINAAQAQQNNGNQQNQQNNGNQQAQQNNGNQQSNQANRAITPPPRGAFQRSTSLDSVISNNGNRALSE